MNRMLLIKWISLFSVFINGSALAEPWLKIKQAEPSSSEIRKKFELLGLACELFVNGFDGKSVLAGCRQTNGEDQALGLYILTKTEDTYSKNLLFKLGDASWIRALEFHTEKTVASGVQGQLPNLNDQKVVLIDVGDESTCFATEVFELQGKTINHSGTVELYTLGYSVHPDTQGYEVKVECLSQYAKVSSDKGIKTLTFLAPKIYSTSTDSGNLLPLKKGALKYRLTSSKLTRVQSK